VSSSEVFSHGGFASLIDREDILRLQPWTDVEASQLAEAVHALSSDNFMQCTEVRDLSGFSCWLVDRQIALAHASYTVDELAGVPYDHYVPSSLINNWNILEIMYPRMNEQWDLIVVDSQHERRTPRGRIYEALNAAVHTFLVAATIERYYHMAVALSTIGMAHRKLTGELSFMTNCYAHATRCAQWSGDSELTAFLAHAYSELEQEASKTTAPDHVDQ
jgi:hypothetical protein